MKIHVSFAKDPYKRELHSEKETYIFGEPANRRHPIKKGSTKRAITYPKKEGKKGDNKKQVIHLRTPPRTKGRFVGPVYSLLW